ncbi:hypothetical protein SNOG_12455 [Parastagonospora nodorum SN15]|uniref:Uncharacterized protein n=1 Tax=Phaeosphaeria nodorum (strain SN15 / ATCC MYA-4574 / FGSC 10173) TaxID=321614 RepID=Q0U709_PHANO|nr:hypothetical protein SNOG_12455 [Parastagonospora nodorum SN15]EAT80268.1 hypothetical protein SNOG_12455 [Parastagonospora nodorum SN15]
MSYHSNPNSALPSPSHFDHPGAVELEPFPQYLPLRPEIPLFWCRRPVQITFGIILFLAILIGAVVASMFTGKSLRTAHYIKHPESPETIVMPTMKVTSNVTRVQRTLHLGSKVKVVRASGMQVAEGVGPSQPKAKVPRVQVAEGGQRAEPLEPKATGARTSEVQAWKAPVARLW